VKSAETINLIEMVSASSVLVFFLEFLLQCNLSAPWILNMCPENLLMCSIYVDVNINYLDFQGCVSHLLGIGPMFPARDFLSGFLLSLYDQNNNVV
jgi:hypothetical protein